MSNNFIQNNTIKNFKSDKLQVFFISEKQNNIFANLGISIDKFENFLSKCLQIFKKEKIHQNMFKIYSFDNKHLKLFNDGSCFSFKSNNKIFKELSFKNDVFKTLIVESHNEQIQNDEFPGLDIYNIIDYHSEIVIKITDKINLIFSKCKTQSNKIKYLVFFDIKPKNTNNLENIEKYVVNCINELLTT